MKLMSKIILITSAIFVSGYANASTDQAIAAAEKARMAAAGVGYEWRDTAKMIKQAKKLAADGKTEQAMKLANKAEEQGKDALSQYRAEKKRYSSNY